MLHVIRNVKQAWQNDRTHGVTFLTNTVARVPTIKIVPWLMTRLAARHRVNRLRYEAPADSLRLLWVDPATIVYHRRSFVPRWDVRKIEGCDWDKLDSLFGRLAKHKAINARVEGRIE